MIVKSDQSAYEFYKQSVLQAAASKQIMENSCLVLLILFSRFDNLSCVRKTCLSFVFLPLIYSLVILNTSYSLSPFALLILQNKETLLMSIDDKGDDDLLVRYIPSTGGLIMTSEAKVHYFKL